MATIMTGDQGLGSRWKQIAGVLEDRTAASVRNKYRSLRNNPRLEEMRPGLSGARARDSEQGVSSKTRDSEVRTALEWPFLAAFESSSDADLVSFQPNEIRGNHITDDERGNDTRSPQKGLAEARENDSDNPNWKTFWER
jgi:hypothetical protein